MMQPIENAIAEQIAKRFHEAYERLAVDFGYTTRAESAVPWDDVPEQNRRLMIATVRELLDGGEIMLGDGEPPRPWTRSE